MLFAFLLPIRAQIAANSAANLLHSHATTTDIYVRSAGLYGDRSVMMDALGESSIGIAAEQLLEMEIPRRPEPREAFCKHASVNNRLQ